MRHILSPRLIIISACVGIAMLTALAVGQSQTKVPPREHPEKAEEPANLSNAKLQLPEEAFDFGYFPNNSKVSHVFQLRSVGEDPLKILRVKPG